jgi:dihydroorotate dehydrogenase
MFTFARFLYPQILRWTRNNPEGGHQALIQCLKGVDRLDRGGASWLLEQIEQSFGYQDQRLSQNLWGLDFPNPLGLAPGCDKDGEAAAIWPAFGFGFAELGAVTHHAQEGNPRPRLFRLTADQAALNRLGANNQGAAVMAQTLAQTWAHYPHTIPIGINLCKSKITPLAKAPQDYAASFQLLEPWADYFVVNVSSPNTPGLRDLQAPTALEQIILALQQENKRNKPILIKISPDLDWPAIDTLVELTCRHQLAGIVATNTTLSRQNLKTQILPQTGLPLTAEMGGISGIPLRQRSTEVIRYIYQKTQGHLPIIGVGGIFSAVDAWEKITAGASLLQMYTGWIYRGPWVSREILQGLSQILGEQGLTHISQAVGRGSNP